MVHLVALLAVDLLALRAVAVLHFVLFAADNYLARGEGDVVNVAICEIFAVSFFGFEMFSGHILDYPDFAAFPAIDFYDSRLIQIKSAQATGTTHRSNDDVYKIVLAFFGY